MLSSDQNNAMTLFAQGKNIFLTGPGGTGKSFLIHAMIDHAKSTGKSCQVCALTGCAALLLECQAKTIHSWSGIHLMNNPDDEIVRRISQKQLLKEQWKMTDILVVDEVSMMPKRMFELLNRIGQKVRRNDKPFGGLQVVFVGDFFQLPPIDKDGFCFESEEWFTVFPKSQHIELTTCFRQSDSDYIDILMKVRKGVLDKESIAILEGYVARKMEKPVTKVVPLRKQADGINQSMFEKLQEPAYSFPVVFCKHMTLLLDGKPISLRVQEACDAMSELDKTREFESLMKHHNICSNLILKKGAQVMCTRNLDTQICNGSQGVVVDIVNNRPLVLFSNGRQLLMDKIWFQSEPYPTLAVGQYPLMLAWAVTIHKIQGCTLTEAQLDIGGGIFEYGQTYVALSRVKSLDGLYLINFNHLRIKAHPKVLAFYDSL
jgi:ATP-dependent DNA helicase PIF1